MTALPEAMQPAGGEPMGLRQAIRTRAFALTAELTPLADCGKLVESARRLGDCVDAVEVPDNPGGRATVPALVAAAALRDAGIDPVLHVSGRDRNRIALQSELLGAATLGIPSLLLMRGRRPPAGLPSPGRAVLEVDATELIATARVLADGQAPFGQGLARPPDFFIGATATVFDPAGNWQPQALMAKLDAGALFVRMQVCMDVEVLRRYMKRLVAAQLTRRAHVLIGLAVLPSAAAAKRLRDSPRGALIPDEMVRRLEEARDPEATGVQICAELLREFADTPGVSGATLVPYGSADAIRAAVEASGLRAEPKPKYRHL